MIEVRRYTPDELARWDAFVRASINGTFLHERGYMDYHADRFADHSLLFWDSPSRGQLLAVLPAHEREGTLYSHQGLTYGGLLVGANAHTTDVLTCFEVLREYMRAERLRALDYRPAPYIYHRQPAQHDLYALAVHGACLTGRQMLTVRELGGGLPFSQQRERGLKRARAAGVQIQKCAQEWEWHAYWQLLEQTLHERHIASPVHTRTEILLLRDRFPLHIRLFAAFEGETMQAGVLIYETVCCARSQYIASSARGREIGALDAVFAHLLREVYAGGGQRYFDFGSSHTAEAVGRTRAVNSGLIAQKEGFGASGVMMDTYLLEIAS